MCSLAVPLALNLHSIHTTGSPAAASNAHVFCKDHGNNQEMNLADSHSVPVLLNLLPSI